MRLLILLISVLSVVSYALFPSKMMVLKTYSHGIWGHLIAFFFLSAIFFFTTKARIFFQFFVLLLIGVLIELLQMMTTYRNASFEDFIYDAIGISIFYLFVLIFRKAFKIKKQYR